MLQYISGTSSKLHKFWVFTKL